MLEGGEGRLRDPHVDQFSKGTDLARGSFHNKAVSISGFEKLLNSVQTFARTHSRQEGRFLSPSAARRHFAQLNERINIFSPTSASSLRWPGWSLGKMSTVGVGSMT
jgi:hypothetical protein